MSESPPKVFISHASEDKPFVRPFAEKLRENGVDAWFDEWEIMPGNNLVDKIFSEGIKGSDAFVVVLSKASVEKPWVKEELSIAVVRRIIEAIKIIPIKIDDCEIPAPLLATAWQNIDPNKEYEDEFQRILSAIFNLSAKPVLGEPPTRFLDFSTIGQYSPEESQILNILIRKQYSVGFRNMETGDLENDLSPFPAATVKDALESLEADNLVEVRRWSGSGQSGFSRVKVTPTGFIEYGKYALDFDPETDVRGILTALVSEGTMRGGRLEEILGIDPTRINYAVRYLQRLGYAEYPETKGSPPYAFVRVSATINGKRAMR